MTIARIAEIWRYPVKSMQGESLDEARVGPGGLHGDRYRAVVDVDTGVSLSAKRYPDLLQCRAWTRGDDVFVRLPGADEFPADSDDLAQALTALLGRQVAIRTAPSVDTIRHEFPTAVTEGRGDPFLYEPETEAFTDSAPLHALTTATLKQLQQLLPASDIKRARFRPNFLIETDATGFAEHAWVGADVTMGELAFHVFDDTRRCIMVALAQGDIPRDTEVIRTILKRNEGRAGVALRALATGTVRIGDRVIPAS